MSVTYFCPYGPEKEEQQPCYQCEDQAAPSPECSVCAGSGFETYLRPTISPLNLSNDRAEVFFEILGLRVLGNDSPFMGRIERRHFDQVRRRAMSVLNGPEVGRRLFCRGEEEGGHGLTPGGHGGGDSGGGDVEFGARWIKFGIDDEYIVRRLQDFLRLLAEAESMGLDISYS